MSGPVTRLTVALQEWVHTGDGARLRSAISGENITSAQLELMDAAAALCAQAADLRLDLAQIGVEAPDAGHVSLTSGRLTYLAEEELCLRLLERAVKRRLQRNEGVPGGA